MKKLILVLTIALTLGTCALLHAAGIEVPEGDPFQGILSLIQNYSGVTNGFVAAAIAVIVQLLRRFLPTGDLKQGLVVSLGVVWGLFELLASGVSTGDALVATLVTAGGAVAIYEFVIKRLFKKEG